MFHWGRSSKSTHLKSYYHAHESAYRQIKAKGLVGWGNAKSLDELGDPQTNEYLVQKIERYFSISESKFALDLGCGTGTTAFTLARTGFATTGIDISETAIEMGQQLAQLQGLNIEFIAGDVLSLGGLDRKFDVIYDSHLFHCIVFDEDRRQVLLGAKEILQSGGIFILDTMCMPDAKIDLEKKFEPLRFDQDFILWHKTKPSKDRGIVEIEGQHWCAQRRIYPVEKIISEVIEAGLEVLERQIDEQQDSPSMLRLVLR